MMAVQGAGGAVSLPSLRSDGRQRLQAAQADLNLGGRDGGEVFSKPVPGLGPGGPHIQPRGRGGPQRTVWRGGKGEDFVTMSVV